MSVNVDRQNPARSGLEPMSVAEAIRYDGGYIFAVPLIFLTAGGGVAAAALFREVGRTITGR